MSLRSEHEVFQDLQRLCTSSGFIHAIAVLCLRDTFVAVTEEMTPDDLDYAFSPERLIRTEITTLIGLLLRAPITYSIPEPAKLSEYLSRTVELLQELHAVLADKLYVAANHQSEHEDTFTDEAIREPIFYSPDSAYFFQYRDMFVRKYRQDADWLIKTKGFEPSVAHQIATALPEILTDQIAAFVTSTADEPAHESTVLTAFTISYAELAARIGQSIQRVRAVVDAFAVPDAERNATFASLTDFNSAYAYPVVARNPDQFILLQYYGFVEALYDVPFYWMIRDSIYQPLASRHRGAFAEELSSEFLVRVFGDERVFTNVELVSSGGETLGEIDVLVVFADCAIVLQAKSKRLTLEGRKGNDRQLRRDFKLAVADSVTQALSCGALLEDSSVRLRRSDGGSVPSIPNPLTVFPVSIVTDHYPALALQVRQFLNATPTEHIMLPLVTDIFALDAITEMLQSPIMLLHYLKSRGKQDVEFFANNELVLLSLYLKHGLAIDQDRDLVVVGDDVSDHLDIAMTVRREQIRGVALPTGMLTWLKGTLLQRIFDEIDDRPRPVTIRLGLMLLDLAEDAALDLDDQILTTIERTRVDGTTA